ncbi:hypothetical protein BT96DRAFT_954511 [Gymnopus androsaceus JB14]|uniref:CxC1-like cysteine cluster associated with KDZ transposases domain-containing protein n=1 Tax=Gymnopus androsaceus JB14 TaxID=1447944 RepID=A0A6A4IA36_9AGAR|nr:hypothetical protein BT96DRAFT_954511 [Gymnopus androsaceus JB14]
MTTSKVRLKGTGKTNSRRHQVYGAGSTSVADFLRNSTVKKATKSQIATLKAQEAARAGALKPNKEFWEERSTWDGVIGEDDFDEDFSRVEEVLQGQVAMDQSNAGDWQDITGAYWTSETGKRKYKEYRTRRDRTERRNQRFAIQLEPMTDAYMAWYGALGQDGLGGGIPGDFEGEIDTQTVVTVDLFRSYYSSIDSSDEDRFWSCSLVRNGVFPCSPGVATVGITTRALEVFRIQSLRCPRLSIKAFVKSLCDIQGVPFKPYLQVQFSIAFDLYLNILSRVHKRVQAALGRDSPNWRLANACPCCLYRVEGEPELRFRLLATWDGGNSCKRLKRSERVEVVDEDQPQLPKSREHADSRKVDGEYYLTREEVDEWSKERIKEISEGQVEDEENPCAERWKNLSEELTAKMWGVFEETGIFVCLCRHSFVLLIVDMVESGELAKYPLAILNRLLDVIGEDIGIGYDVRCGFGTTANKSPLGEKARRLRFTSLVGAFHGHAHSRLCQTCYLATYIKGLGLEHLEQCETFFSESNELASSVRHMSVFHRRQAIARYCYHHDNFEAYSRLSKFIVDNYKQALEILATRPALAKTMSDLGIASTDTFDEWLREEREYLKGLKKEPAEETLQMEYYKKLVKLEDSEAKLTATTREWITYTPDDVEQVYSKQDHTRRIETQRRHAMENRDDLKKEVQSLEMRLEIKERWVSGSEEWEKTKKLVGMAKYQRALDKLEGLIVARLFELTKLNMSRTGYKLRTHIANALKARSQAIRTAVTAYNDAASELNCPLLTWQQVLDYSFLSDFDLLREARRDVRGELWAQPAGRLALDQYHKLSRAPEEIMRLNKEIRALVTYIHEETTFIRLKFEEIRQTDPLLAIQIQKHGWERGRCNDMHILRLRKLEKMAGFTGSLAPGRGALYPVIQAAMEMDSQVPPLNDRDADEDAPPADEDSDDEDDTLAELTTVLQICAD